MLSIVFVTLIFFQFPLYSNEIRIEATVANPQTSFTIGDKIELNYRLTYAPELKLIKPDIFSWFSNFEILDYSIDSSWSNFTVTLITFETGDFEIPAITFNFEDTITSKIYTVASDCINLKIADITLDENPALKDIPQKKLQEYQFNYILLIGLILLFAAFIFLLYKIRHKN